MTAKIGEQLNKIANLQKLQEQTQGLIDNAIYELVNVAGGKTFEYEGKFYQIRVPNTSRTDRQRAISKHPFLCVLDQSPKTAKANAKLRNGAQETPKAALTEEETKANLQKLLEPTEEETALTVAVDAEEETLEGVERQISDEGDDDGIVIEGGA